MGIMVYSLIWVMQDLYHQRSTHHATQDLTPNVEVGGSRHVIPENSSFSLSPKP